MFTVNMERVFVCVSDSLDKEQSLAAHEVVESFDISLRLVAEMPAEVSNTEPNQAESRNGNVAADNSAPAAANDTSRLEAGGEMEAEDSAVPTVPDGGWGWMVVFGSFMIHVIADGIAYSFGVFVEDFVVHFQCSKSAVGGLGSLMVLIAGGSGNC